MNNKIRFTALALCFGFAAIATTGCDDLAGVAMETALESTKEEDPTRASFAEKLDELKESCPREINEYTTLKWVKLKGLNRIEFRYQVSESGRPIVNLNNRSELRPAMVKRTLDGPLYDSIMDLDLSVDHVFRDGDNKQMYSTTVTKLDLKKAVKEAAIAKAKAAKEEAEKAASMADQGGPMITVMDPFNTSDSVAVTPVSNPGESWMPEEAPSTSVSESNPAGVRENPFGTPSEQANPYFQ